MTKVSVDKKRYHELVAIRIADALREMDDSTLRRALASLPTDQLLALRRSLMAGH